MKGNFREERLKCLLAFEQNQYSTYDFGALLLSKLFLHFFSFSKIGLTFTISLKNYEPKDPDTICRGIFDKLLDDLIQNKHSLQ